MFHVFLMTKCLNHNCTVHFFHNATFHTRWLIHSTKETSEYIIMDLFKYVFF